MTNTAIDERPAIEAPAIAYLNTFHRADVADVLATCAADGVLMAPGRPPALGKDGLATTYPGVFAAVISQ